jgi:hypothetical protein
MSVRKELMRHAMTDSKRQAHSKGVEMVLRSKKPDQTSHPGMPGCRDWKLMGVFQFAQNPRN